MIQSFDSDDVDFLINLEKKQPEEANKYKVSAIPKDYQWCPDCCGLTKHIPHERKYNGPECEICGHYEFSGLGCPNCGWWDESVVDGPDHEEVTLHHNGCHFHPDWMVDETSENLIGQIMPAIVSYAVQTAHDFFKNNFYDEFYGYYAGPNACHPGTPLWHAFKNATNEDTCGCPRSLVFYNINVLGRWSQRTYEGDWDGGCTIRCPICGEVFDYEW